MPVKTLPELIAHAKANAGKLSYATPNSTSLVAMETIKRIAGIDIAQTPYKSSPQAMSDLIGGQVQVYVADFGSGLAVLASFIEVAREVLGQPARAQRAARLTR